MALAWSILHLTFEVLPLMFGRAYNCSSQANVLVSLSISVASVVVAVVAIFQDCALTTSTSRISSFISTGPTRRPFIFCLRSEPTTPNWSLLAQSYCQSCNTLDCPCSCMRLPHPRNLERLPRRVQLPGRYVPHLR